MPPLVIAHRGASAARPENTFAAFALAVKQGADMIETDLHRTRDGAIVLAHDATLGRLGGRGEIADATRDELRELDAGGGEPPPWLEEALDAFGDRIAFNLELKRATRPFHAAARGPSEETTPRRSTRETTPEPHGPRAVHGSGERTAPYPGIEAAALEAVRARGLLARTLFSSFFDTDLERLRRLDRDARIGLLISPRRPEQAVARAKALAAEALHPAAALVTAALVADAHAAGLAVYPYTVDDPAEMRRLLDLGADGLFTNHPDRLRALLQG